MERDVKKKGEKASPDWFVYILECADGSLYTGITTDPDRRVAEHNEGVGARYTRARLPVSMVFHERVENRSVASRLEYRIKRLSRKRKRAIICKDETLADLCD